MQMATEPAADPLLSNLCSALFLVAEAKSEIHCPVVTLQQDPYNVYSLLEKYLRPEALPQADRFWRNVRLMPAGFAVWRPRVSGIQLKMLQHARMPRAEGEWAAVGAALEALPDALQPGKSAAELLVDLREFCVNVEQWWAGRRRSDGAATKRPSQGGQHGGSGGEGGGGGKRVALDGVHPALLASTMPLQLGDLGAAFSIGAPSLQFHGRDELNAYGVMDAHLPQVVSAAALAEMANGPPRSAGAGKLLTLNVGGQRFCTTPATLEAVDGSYFSKLSQKVAATGKAEFFIDRAGGVFQLVLDHLRAQRYGHPPVALPVDRRALGTLREEAAYYRLGTLEQQAADALAAGPTAPPGEEITAVFLSTGFCQEAVLGDAHGELLRRLNIAVAAKRADGFAVMKRDCGTEREGALRNLYYHVLLSRPLPA